MFCKLKSQNAEVKGLSKSDNIGVGRRAWEGGGESGGGVLCGRKMMGGRG